MHIGLFSASMALRKYATNMMPYTSIGLMSGTSADGIDAVRLRYKLGTVKVEAKAALRYPVHFQHLLKAAMLGAAEYQGNLETLGAQFPNVVSAYFASLGQAPDKVPAFEDIITESTAYHAQLIAELMTPEVDVIGYHGQTLWHRPPCSIQVGHPDVLAKQFQRPVVSQFRQADLDADGQGAPLAPVYHQLKGLQEGWGQLALINCGGISNITLCLGTQLSDLYAWDCGPGNVLLDRWVRQCTHGQQTMDRDGQYAQQGMVNQDMLVALRERCCQKLGQNYFDQPPPKSLCVSDFTWLPEWNDVSLEDGCATLAAFTAACIVESLRFATKVPARFILAGGGWHHPGIHQQFIQQLHDQYDVQNVHTATELGWDSDTLEAEIFAVAAIYRLLNQPFTGPTITGATKDVVAGEVWG